MNTNRRRRVPSKSKPLTRAEFLRLSPWIRERATRLHRQFVRVEVARKRGKSLKSALAQFCWYWRGERYRRDESKAVRFSMNRLRTLYYHWRTNGRIQEALALRYGTTAKPKPTIAHITRFLDAVADPDMMTMHAGFIKSAGALRSQFKWSFFCCAQPPTLRASVRRLLKSRRKHRSEQRRFVRFATGWKTAQRRHP